MPSPHSASIANLAPNQGGPKIRRAPMCRCLRRLAAMTRRCPCVNNLGWRRWQFDLPVNRDPLTVPPCFRACAVPSLTEAVVNALCFLSDKELLRRNGMRGVADPAPQWQLKRSCCATCSGLDRARRISVTGPISQHDATHPCFPNHRLNQAILTAAMSVTGNLIFHQPTMGPPTHNG